MNVSRKIFAAGAATSCATIANLRYPAGAAEFVYKLAHGNTADHPVSVHTTAAAERIKQESGGRLEIQTFPNSALGNAIALIAQARLGAIEFVIPGEDSLSSVVPVAQMESIPFAFSSYQNAWS